MPLCTPSSVESLFLGALQQSLHGTIFFVVYFLALMQACLAPACFAVQEDFAMGAAAGAFAAAATTPLDVIKTNMMCTAASRPTMVSSARTVLAQGGPTSFFRSVSCLTKQEACGLMHVGWIHACFLPLQCMPASAHCQEGQGAYVLGLETTEHVDVQLFRAAQVLTQV